MTPTAEVLSPETRISGTVILPSDTTNTVGLIQIGSIDGNLLIAGGFIVVIIAVMALVATVYISIRGSQGSTTPDTVRQILDSTFQGAFRMWDEQGDRVRETATVEDDALYYLANVPVGMIKTHLETLGFKVTSNEQEVVVQPTETGNTG